MKLEVKEINNTPVLLIFEQKRGFERGVSREFIAMQPELAMRIGRELIDIGFKCMEKKNG